MIISTKEQLKKVLSTELGEKSSNILFFKTNRFSLLWLLRYTEYFSSKRGFFGEIIFRIFMRRYTRVQLLTGCTIPLGVFGEGLTIFHTGSIVVNGKTRIGRNCCIMNNVNIGANNGEIESPRIGDNVYIGPGAVIFGNIEIADNCWVGANAVVNKTVSEKGSVLLGVPAVAVKKSNLVWWQKNNMNREL